MILGKNPSGDIVHNWNCSSGLYGGRPGDTDLEYLEWYCWHKIYQIYKETGAPSKPLSLFNQDLQRSGLVDPPVFPRAGSHNDYYKGANETLELKALMSFFKGSPVLGSVVLSSGAAAGSAVYKVSQPHFLIFLRRFWSINTILCSL